MAATKPKRKKLTAGKLEVFWEYVEVPDAEERIQKAYEILLTELDYPPRQEISEK